MVRQIRHRHCSFHIAVGTRSALVYMYTKNSANYEKAYAIFLSFFLFGILIHLYNESTQIVALARN